VASQTRSPPHGHGPLTPVRRRRDIITGTPAVMIADQEIKEGLMRRPPACGDRPPHRAQSPSVAYLLDNGILGPVAPLTGQYSSGGLSRLVACPSGGYILLVFLSFLFIVSILVDIRSLRSLGRSTPPLYRLRMKPPWDRDSPSLAPPAPHRKLHEQRFFFLAPWAIAFALSCVYGRSLLTD